VRLPAIFGKHVRRRCKEAFLENAPLRIEIDRFLDELRKIASSSKERKESFQELADFLREFGKFRWVGLYDVEHAEGLVKNIAWSGEGAPEYPVFPLTKGLTSSAISFRRTINVGDVASDPRYLTALGSTRSEIIVPVLDATGGTVIGTIDVESEKENAFDAATQSLLESAANTLGPYWKK
jgi:putative methionine-R-sulfoxide reductase with GAF domain